MSNSENDSPYLDISGLDISGLVISGPRLDEPAPQFTARTTLGTRSLSDYLGKWLILFSHPADFTPVCTSEFIAFANADAEFKDLDCELLGMSIDSVYSHIAWLKSIEIGFDTTITFPVIEDVSMAISNAYGMIHENSISTATARSVFFIDPQGILRAITHYPVSVGRSVKEILRVLTALQIAESENVSLPEGWQPGDKAVRNPPSEFTPTTDDHSGPTWYYQEIDLSGKKP